MTATTAHLSRSETGPPGPDADVDAGADAPTAAVPAGRAERERQERRAKLCPPMPGDRLVGWVAPVLVAVAAGVLRFWRLTEPRGLYFDEVYYVKDAWGLMTAGYEINSKTCDGPAYVVHPPLGKWLMAASQWLFGYVDCAGTAHGSPELGWRFSSALAGTLAVLVLARAARRIFRSTLLGCFAGLLLALDGLAFVQSRIGILDIFLMTGIVIALACLVLDRDDGRRRMAARLDRMEPGAAGSADARFGPRLGPRPWRILMGVALGASMGVKWSALYTVVGFAALALAWDVGARRTAGAPSPFLGALRRDLPGWLVGFVALPVVTFLATWTGWFVTDGGWNRDAHGDGFVNAWHSWWDYQRQVLKFHEGLSDSHPFRSTPMSWLVLGRPIAYFYSSPAFGAEGCTAPGGCSREVIALGNPAIWWGGTAALVGSLVLWVRRRDWRAALVLVGFGSAFLPWLLLPGRTMFFFYALPSLPFLVLGLTAMAGLALGPREASDVRRLTGALAVGVYTVAVVLLFAYFYPILAAEVIPYSSWRMRMWFPGWI
ncbi:glycosyl transferase [Parafrankia colletiae]|uniref:Polyprenol-phosphate-mannose--protein mannosyltransferase n=1 Tax=Parafrankia colletiae TaxID=573497 RepID=A0A1S1QV32_9ACTN|nr:phospholipid carrier-dependent glycosyltransferase [Parafrankia colletiae]MCK9900274.1 phospholipid carrier-dependent glycosyltransferase [Frankia sp. Cpl3]OHV36274.1 glycosyl transferase [Parafrankia colletiae]